MRVEPIQIKSLVGNLVKLAILALKNSFVHFIPFHNSVEDSQNCFAKMTTPTKKLRVRFSTEDDLNLLRLVLGENPFEDTTRWILIQQTIIGVTNKQFTLRTVKEHVDYLLKLFLKEDKANLKKSGTEEEYQEKQRLLQEISDLKREYFNSSEANNSVSISKQKERGVEIRDSALKNCSEGVSVDHQEEYSTNANSIDELVHVSVSTVLDGASGGLCVPLVTPSTLLLSSRGRVKLCPSRSLIGCGPPAHLVGYLAPEHRTHKQFTDTETEKMWIYALGETLKRATLTSHAATSRLSGELCQVLTDMTKPQAVSRASLMHLLDVISDYCKKRQQNRPFSHIVMDLHQEAMAAIEIRFDTPWGPPAMPELGTRMRYRCDSSNTDSSSTLTIPRRWIGLGPPRSLEKPKLTKEASTSMEDLSLNQLLSPGAVMRPKSLCIPTDISYYNTVMDRYSSNVYEQLFGWKRESNNEEPNVGIKSKLHRQNLENCPESKIKRLKTRRNPVQRAASRLYRASSNESKVMCKYQERDCVGPEFVVRAALPNKQITMIECKGLTKKSVTVIMLNGQKLDVLCNPNTTTAGQLFELIIQKELIEENFMLGLSALIAGDFIFLPSDARICKAATPGCGQNAPLTLFVRVRFFLPSLRGIRGLQTRHLLYLQLRRSILEHQLPCPYKHLLELGGLALQAEFGDFNEREHGARDYFLIEHYIPETMIYNLESSAQLRQELTRVHVSKKGLDAEKVEEDFILLTQTLPHYGGHFYTATWILKDNTDRDVWLYISAQGINLYERRNGANPEGPVLYEMFEWRTIQTLCYSKHYLCILPHNGKKHGLKLKKYKLKMDHKKSYFTFRLASLHHQFFLRLRTEFTSLQSLSHQFGIPLKDMKNETNSLYKLEALTNPLYIDLDKATVNADTEFKIEFKFQASSRSDNENKESSKCKRSRSVSDFSAVNDNLEEYQNKENENPQNFKVDGLILDSSYLSGLQNTNIWDKRRGVKMGVRAFTTNGRRVSRSMEAMNGLSNDELEQLSLQSVSLHCSSTSRSPVAENGIGTDAYIIDTSVKSCGNEFLPNFQETLSESLLEKLNNISFVEERMLRSVIVVRDAKGSLGLQITEGSDGKVYVQTVISGGPAGLTEHIFCGDQIIAVDGKNLTNLKYEDALELLKSTGERVEFILSQLNTTLPLIHSSDEPHISKIKSENNFSKLSPYKSQLSINSENRLYENSPIEKHLTESCHDITNVNKYSSFENNSDVPYHKHIRYEFEPELDTCLSKKDLPISNYSINASLNKNISKSCSQLYVGTANNKAVIVEMIPKSHINLTNLNESYRKAVERSDHLDNDKVKKNLISPIALPRSLGLSRKWRGPVRYPVTPVKKSVILIPDDSYNYVTTSDDEQVFI